MKPYFFSSQEEAETFKWAGSRLAYGPVRLGLVLSSSSASSACKGNIHHVPIHPDTERWCLLCYAFLFCLQYSVGFPNSHFPWSFPTNSQHTKRSTTSCCKMFCFTCIDRMHRGRKMEHFRTLFWDALQVVFERSCRRIMKGRSKTAIIVDCYTGNGNNLADGTEMVQ